MSKLVTKVERALGHHKGGADVEAAQKEAAEKAGRGASKQFTGIDPNAAPVTARGRGGRSLDQIPGLRIPLGTPSTPLGPRRPNAPRRKY